jgi:hypothetical protein
VADATPAAKAVYFEDGGGLSPGAAPHVGAGWSDTFTVAPLQTKTC